MPLTNTSSLTSDNEITNSGTRSRTTRSDTNRASNVTFGNVLSHSKALDLLMQHLAKELNMNINMDDAQHRNMIFMMNDMMITSI